MYAKLYIVLSIAAASLAIAAACFYLGGVIAEAANATPIMGVTFKASGALAGFLISFLTLFYAYQMLNPPLRVKVGVASQKGPFARTGNVFKAKSTVLKPASGAKREQDVDAIWEAGGLTIHLRGVEQDDLVMIVVTDANGNRWESDFFSPLCPSIILV
jgi:hypothetical protein